MSSPTQRSLALLRKEGWLVQVVERWNAHAKIRQDLFGCIDLVAVEEGHNGVLGVQATSRSNQAARLTKSLGQEALKVWLAAGNSFQVWGWAKAGKRGQRKTWQVTRRVVTLDDIP